MAGRWQSPSARVSVALAGAVLIAALTVAAGGHRSEAGGWDRRVEPIAHTVEQLRHLRFEHPIPARFLSDRAFRKVVAGDEHPSARDRRRDDVSEAELRALGLASGSFDLRGTVTTLNGDDILAFYDSETGRIVVRGKRLDAEHRITLAHELTHGLQDQHYDLDTLERAAHTGGADNALTALVEGDASRVEDEYYWKMSKRDRRVVDRAEGVGDTGVGPDGGPANPDAAASGDSFVGAQLDAPYAFGPGIVDVILAVGHRPGLARAFHRPPATQLQMLQPSSAAGSVAPVRLAAPTLPAGARRRASGPDDVGAVDLYLLLASRLPNATAIRAADAWGNSRELISERDGRICTDLVFTGRNASGSARLADALRRWRAAMPAGAVELAPDGLALHACDPGVAATAPPNAAGDALAFAAARAFVESQMVEGGIPPHLATCMADHAVDRPDYEAFVGVATSDEVPKGAAAKQFDRTLQALADSCA